MLLRMLWPAMLVVSGLFGCVKAQVAAAPKLPATLGEAEAQLIRKEQALKNQVEAVLKVADARLLNALKLAQTGESEAAVAQLNVYGELYEYADAVTRRLPAAEQKERNKVLKLIEQGIFKQQRTLEATRRELPFNDREATDKLVESLKRIRIRALNDVLGNGEFMKQN